MMSLNGPTCWAQLRGTPPPTVKMPSRFGLLNAAGVIVQVQERIERRHAGEKRLQVGLVARAVSLRQAVKVATSSPNSESVKAGT